MKKFNWGIIATGKISETMTQALRECPNANLYAIASRSNSKALTFKDKYSFQKAYSSYEDLVNDNNVDIIYVGTPHVYHYENVRLALKAGKNVLCEKPFTMNSDEAKELIALAKDKNLFLMEAMWTRFFSTIQKVKEWVSNGKIGSIKKMEGSFGILKEYDVSSRLFNPKLGGGALLDLGIYPISLASYLMNQEPKEIKADMKKSPLSIDLSSSYEFTYKNGVKGYFSSSYEKILNNTFTIIGETGSILLEEMFHCPSKVVLTSQKNKSFENSDKRHGFCTQAEHVMKMLELGKKESDIMPLKDTLSIIQTMDKVREKLGLVY